MLTDKEKELANRLGKAFAMDYDSESDEQSEEYPCFICSNPLSLIYYTPEKDEYIENVSIDFLKEMAVGFEKSPKGIDVKEFWDLVLSNACYAINDNNDFSYLEQLIENNLVDLNAMEPQEIWANIDVPVYLVEEIIIRATGRAGIDFLKKHDFDLNKINWKDYISHFEQCNFTEQESIELLNAMKELQAAKESLADKA